MAHPPAVVSMADQMTAEMTERSTALVRVGAAIATTMQVLIERGLLASSGGQ